MVKPVSKIGCPVYSKDLAPESVKIIFRKHLQQKGIEKKNIVGEVHKLIIGALAFSKQNKCFLNTNTALAYLKHLANKNKKDQHKTKQENSKLKRPIFKPLRNISIRFIKRALSMASIPGGEFILGLTAKKMTEIKSKTGITPTLSESFRKVKLLPFKVSRKEVSSGFFRHVMGTDPISVRELFKKTSSRLAVTNVKFSEAMVFSLKLSLRNIRFKKNDPLFRKLVKLNNDTKQWSPGNASYMNLAMVYFKIAYGPEGKKYGLYRLPTKNEIERATRGPKGQYGLIASSKQDYDIRSVNSGQKNPYGLYNLLGNAAEIVVNDKAASNGFAVLYTYGNSAGTKYYDMPNGKTRATDYFRSTYFESIAKNSTDKNNISFRIARWIPKKR
ncbi:SUMF1/EgtB/PvdO family nonheme iron enzyme [bacterium]|nr:SUMF1/EgtB/PvdO family nonheme iron enzyme [bacterium]